MSEDLSYVEINPLELDIGLFVDRHFSGRGLNKSSFHFSFGERLMEDVMCEVQSSLTRQRNSMLILVSNGDGDLAPSSFRSSAMMDALSERARVSKLVQCSSTLQEKKEKK